MASQPPSNAAPSVQEQAVPSKRPPRRHKPDYRHIHRFPLPLPVHPLPPLIPHNPLSVVSVLLSYLTYFIAPPHNDIHSAYFDSNTSSVHVTDERTIRALWEMGFFGKGSLSRSEPTWLEQEKKRRGLLGGVTSEEVTRQRRAERRELKIQRARSEKLIIEQRLQAEAAAREGHTLLEGGDLSSADGATNGTVITAEKFSVKKAREAKFLEQQLARRDKENTEKNVQFAENNNTTLKADTTVNGRESSEEMTIDNEEHLQLSNEEAFFLVYGLGALHIFDKNRKTVLSSNFLLTLFCHHSYSPPRELTSGLKSDDPFLVSYIVYHHFRSLGWVVRSGVKFGVDYLLYNRGPVFSHAEFAVVVIPSYDHPYWSETKERKAECASKQARSWWWLHCVNRVQAQVKKTLVVCYVEIPPPSQDLEAASASRLEIGALLARYSEDSIDIAALQRVALGLPCFDETTLIENGAFQDPHDLARLPHPEDSHSTSASRSAPDKSPVHGVPEVGDNATRPLDTNRQSLKRTERSALSGPFAAKMGSAETTPSDTQVISQSVYDEIIRKNKEAVNNGLDSNVFDQNALRSLHAGDLDHIDLLSGFDGAHIHPPTTDENDDQSSSKLGESSPLTYERNHFPESQRFVTKTPVTATKQYHNEAISAVSPLVSRNPLASDLESASGVMALSQVFKATQAPSSPPVNGNGLQSDHLSDRPSPNIPIQHRPLGPTLSSPFNTIAATFPRDHSDTPLKYISVKESQANRNVLAEQRMTRSANDINIEDESDGEFEKEPSFVERMRRQRRINQETAKQFAEVSAPSRHSSDLGMQTGRKTSSITVDTEQLVSANNDTAEAVSQESHGPTSELQAVGTSEEETEQEEEVPKPTPRSQVPQSSVDEDKENCDDPSVVRLSQTESAHDRLSQALSLHESPQGSRIEPALASPNARSRLHNGGLDGAVDMIRSSPVSVVKDSQWSQSRDYADQPEQGIAESPSNRSQTGLHGSKPQRKPGFFPTKQAPVQPSNQLSQRHSEQSQTGPAAIPPSTRSDIVTSARSSNPSREGSAVPQASAVRFENSTAETGNRATVSVSRGKSSSMPSRVAETPIHRRQRSSTNDPIPFATIPETSPNRMNNDGWMSDGNNEAADQEDDDLPPPFPRAFEHANQSHLVVSDDSSPIKPHLNSKILSSPSGRQRRALTEIAADVSPQVGGSKFDVSGIDIMSADDHEFRSAVAMSPIPPRKKRRGNDGRNIPASDPIIPFTPRSRPRLTPPREEEEAAAAPGPVPMESTSQRLGVCSGRGKPSRRAGSIWDTEDSPKFRVSSKERSKIFARSLARGRQPSPASEPEPKELPKSTTTANSTPASVPTSVPVPAPAQITSAPGLEEPGNEPNIEENPADGLPQLLPETAILAPNQVLAPWRGQKRAYYPAACFGKPFGTAQDQYLVKFEDSAPVEVPMGTVKRLELRIGDAVKIDMPGVPKVTHIIRGFADKLTADELSNTANGVIPVTDVYGHATFIVGPKQRKSLPSGGLSGPENVINVPVSRIYLDTILWNRLKEHSFTYNSGSGNSETRLQTPSDRHITPTSPGTRLSRTFRPANGLFSGMVFAVSYGDKSESKVRVTKMILENDGQILEDGFNELFELPSNAPIQTPTKSPAPPPASTNVNLRLRPGAEEVGFACLIADKHSRRAKYMQALALGLPCLSDRWIEDSVAKGKIVDWEMYLLPAGESSYLNGATKSRILTPYSAADARLSKTVAARPNLLNGQSVLLITGRNGKAVDERRKAYIFLTYALGASKIERVPDIQSARAILDQSRSQTGEGASTWDWVYMDDESASLSSKKRRKSRPAESSDDLGLDSVVRVVGNEFVCQSLILGRLVDQ
ncbi:chromatin-binding protein RAD9 [Aspergillus undulatus]|uniref:chromatin-binding protein RAD9 n=1 Tax=Aspergillus undulatus TaxID=1810928 RepID=UPI003CCD05A4